MRTIPVDPHRVRILCAGPATPATNMDGTPRLSRDGKTLFNLPVLVLADGTRPEATNVRLPGPFPVIAELTALRFVGLVAWYWQMDNGRSGISLTATEVHQETGGRAAAAATR
jgi:hypothetical protein